RIIPPKKYVIVKRKHEFVDRHRHVLIQRVSNALAIAEELGDMVHNETYNIIQAKETSENRLRVLYSATLHSGGNKVKAAFYDALKRYEPDLMEDLGQLFPPFTKSTW
uniref:CARD domain-containing protein n=1 Tax=Periophthalmus magnuspinnatus TaxID=409849 RepID=A0A3B4AG61_9GOBI